MADFESDRSKKAAQPSPERLRWLGPSLKTTAIPWGLSEASVSVIDEEGSPAPSIRLYGGLVGVTQDVGGVLRAEPGWAVASPSRAVALVERLIAEHEVMPFEFREDGSKVDAWLDRMSAEMVAVYAHTGGARLFGGRIVLWRASQVKMVRADPDTIFFGFDPDNYDFRNVNWRMSAVTLIANLDDGRLLATSKERDSAVVLIDPSKPQRLEEIPVVAANYGDFLSLALDSKDGFWFDADTFLPTATLR